MHPRWKVTIERYQEVMVALSESVIKNRLKCLLAEKARWRPIRLAMKPRFLGNYASEMKSCYGTLSGSDGRSFRIRQENYPEAPPVEISRWRHIHLVIKPRYLGKHVLQIKSYYSTLSRSHGRSFRICHEKSPKAPPSREVTMMSYPAFNLTSLSRKPCIRDKKLL